MLILVSIFSFSEACIYYKNMEKGEMLTEVNGPANTLGNLVGGCIECYDHTATSTDAL
jgi:hypothetical protein